MTFTLSGKLFVYTSLALFLVLTPTFVALERHQSQQWEGYLRLQSLSFARLATPELMKIFRGNFSGLDTPGSQGVTEYLSFNPDLIQFFLLSPGGKVLYSSTLMPGHAEADSAPVPNRDMRTRIQEPEARELILPEGAGRVLEVLAPAFGPTGEQVLLARYLVSFRTVEERMQEVRQRFLIIGAGAMLVALMLVALVSKRITRPIAALTQGARAIARGDLESRLGVSGADEIAGLSLAFNEMTASLAESRRELLAKNEALTKALEDLGTVQLQLVQSERLAVIGQLAAGVSHEIDNPIGIILGYAELLLEDLDAGKPNREDVLEIIEECRRCKKITGGLLGLARSAAMRTAPVDLQQLIESTLGSLRPQKLFREVDLVFVAPGSDIRVLADLDQLRQVLVNLVLNAAQAMKGRGRVEIALGETDDSAWMEVKDSGPGIDAMHAQRIFDPFYTTKPSGEGTGLGLTVCRKLIEELGGSLELVPGRGLGACFRIRLPRVEGTA